MRLSSKMRILRGPGALRIKMGVSQEVFAQYLGIAASTVSMAELGNRPFPAKALQKLAEMELAWANRGMEEAGQAVAPVVASTAVQELVQETRQTIRRLDLSRANFRLNRMVEKYQEVLEGFAHLRLAKQLHGQVEGSQEQRALGRVEVALNRTLRKCNAAQQSKIKGKIELLEIVIAAHEMGWRDIQAQAVKRTHGEFGINSTSKVDCKPPNSAVAFLDRHLNERKKVKVAA